jgi:hypothetical protein
MKLVEDINVQDIISKSLKRSISYSEYRAEVEEFVATNSTSGNEKTEALIDYTMLNDRRMKRWDKTVRVSEEGKARVASYKRNVTWLVLTESWCGDAAHVIPVINKIAELSDYIDLRLVYRDKNEDLMNEFLTNGGKSIPKLIMVDNHSGEVLDTFGPRPSEATQLVLDYKARHGELTPEFKEELQHWYNKDKGQNVIENLLKLLNL